MKTLGAFLVLSWIFLACKNTNNDKGIYIKLNNKTNLDSAPFLSFNCCGDEGFISESICIGNNLKFNTLWQIRPSKEKDNLCFLLLTMDNIGKDSIIYNLELFRIQETDTLRTANLGYKKISSIGCNKEIKKTICRWLNK